MHFNQPRTSPRPRGTATSKGRESESNNVWQVGKGMGEVSLLAGQTENCPPESWAKAGSRSGLQGAGGSEPPGGDRGGLQLLVWLANPGSLFFSPSPSLHPKVHWFIRRAARAPPCSSHLPAKSTAAPLRYPLAVNPSASPHIRPVFCFLFVRSRCTVPVFLPFV